MAEGSPSGKLIVDAKGTERNVLEPKPIVSENPFKEKAEAAAAGLGAALVVEAVETIREKIKHTKSEKVESKSGNETETKSYNFGQVETYLMSGKLNEDKEKFFQAVRNRQIEEFKDVDNGEFVRDTRIAVTRILKNNDWDDVYDELTHYGETRESEMRGRAEIDDRLNGISMAAVRYEAARVLGAGLVKKRREVGQKKYEKWIKEEKSDQYSKEEIETLQKLAKRSFVRLVPDAPEELVGRNIKKDENFVPPVPQQQEIKMVLSEKETNAGFESQLEEKVKKLKKEKAETAEWAKVVLEGIDFAEKESDRERKKSFGQDERSEYWRAVEKAIQEIPTDVGSIDKGSALAKFLSKEYKNGLTFKDRINILFSARRHLNDRFIEMSRAGGSLTKMGVSDEMPFEGISYKVQPISPEDFEMLYHQRELFPELLGLPATELRELLPDLDQASCKWLDIGIKNSSIPEDIMTNEEIDIIRKILDNKGVVIDHYKRKIEERTKEFDEFNSKKHTTKEIDDEKENFNSEIRKFNRNISEINKMSIDSNWTSFELLMDAKILERDEILTYAYIPTFDNSLNNASTGAELRKRMSTSLRSSKGEDLAFRVLTNTLTFEMLDRGRSNLQGSSEPRDIMWAERKRLYEIDKEREPGLDWTVHRYFVSRPDPKEVINEDMAKKSKKLAYRREMLAINAERGVLVEKTNYFEGEIVSDFFHNVMIFTQDELKVKSVRRNLATYVLNADGSVKKGGFKNMPFLEMGPESYSTAGYWGYTIAKAKQLATEISSTTYKKADEELVSDDWWNKKRDLFARLEHTSPRLITIEYKMRGEEIRKLLKEDGRFDENEIKKIAGYSRNEDLDVITDDRLRNEAIRIVTDPKNNIAENAKKKSEKLRDQVIDKFRMVHALGVVWVGSIDAIKNTSTILGDSNISPDLLTKIIRAIEASRYLEGEYLQQFKYEAAEMGFGSRLVSTKKRYRREIDSSMWD